MIGRKIAVTRLVDASKGKLHTEKAQYVQCNVLQQELKNDAMIIFTRLKSEGSTTTDVCGKTR
jgi:hypothetical protein